KQERVVPAVLRIEAGNGELTLGRQVAGDSLGILDEPTSIGAGDTEDDSGHLPMRRRVFILFALRRLFRLLGLLAFLGLLLHAGDADPNLVNRLDRLGRGLRGHERIAEDDLAVSAGISVRGQAGNRIIDGLAIFDPGDDDLTEAGCRHGYA